MGEDGVGKVDGEAMVAEEKAMVCRDGWESEGLQGNCSGVWENTEEITTRIQMF